MDDNCSQDIHLMFLNLQENIACLIKKINKIHNVSIFQHNIKIKIELQKKFSLIDFILPEMNCMFYLLI